VLALLFLLVAPKGCSARNISIVCDRDFLTLILSSDT
jgi:hypothetical protein